MTKTISILCDDKIQIMHHFLSIDRSIEKYLNVVYNFSFFLDFNRPNGVDITVQNYDFCLQNIKVKKINQIDHL